jgi:opacity protein-like surface antigen
MNYPTKKGPNFALLNFFAGFRIYPSGLPEGFYGGLGAGQSWNNNDADRFDIKQVQTHFNFGLHAYAGWRFVLNESVDLAVEARYSHWSNGHFTGDRNLGLNDILLAVAVLFKRRD